MNYDVIVAGAGPVGLFLAVELAVQGVSVLVLERLCEPDLTIKAGAIGATAGEAMERRGLGPKMDEIEREMHAMMMPALKKRFGDVPMKKIGGHFAGLFLIDQSVQRDPDRRFRGVPQAPLEKLLAERAAEAKIEVRRGVELETFTETADGVDVKVRAGDQEQRLSAKYLVGCDGGRSAVRKRAGFEFPGTPPTLTGYQAIVELDHPERLSMGWTRTGGGIMAFGPMPGRCFVVEVTGAPEDRNAPVTLEEVEAALRRVSGADVRIQSISTATRWTDNSRQASSYRKGRVFLAGDAAHVHSPFGGQGINLGFGDAANLGWKLAAAVRGTSPLASVEALLDSYTAERHPVGARVLANTRAQVALLRPDVQTTHLREIVTELMGMENVNRYFGEMISGVTVRYDLGDDHPMVGRLAPNLTLELAEDHREVRLFDLMQDGSAILFGPSDLGEVARGRSTLKVVRTRGGPSMLVRPDGAIAWASHEGEEGADHRLAPAVTRWFGRTE